MSLFFRKFWRYLLKTVVGIVCFPVLPALCLILLGQFVGDESNPTMSKIALPLIVCSFPGFIALGIYVLERSTICPACGRFTSGKPDYVIPGQYEGWDYERQEEILGPSTRGFSCKNCHYQWEN